MFIGVDVGFAQQDDIDNVSIVRALVDSQTISEPELKFEVFCS
jgi:hypothetical protein